MIAALLLTGLLAQDLEGEARGLRMQGRFVEALAILENVDEPSRAALERTLTLWSAGDLGGALLAALDGLATGGTPDTRRQLLSNATELALELGEAAMALDLVTRWEEAIAGASDLTDEERLQWTKGWGPGTGSAAARARAQAVADRLADAEQGVTWARLVTLMIGGLAVVGMVAAGRR